MPQNASFEDLADREQLAVPPSIAPSSLLATRSPQAPGTGPAETLHTVNLRAVRAAMGSGLPDVPGYEVQCELGRGGMGVVYKARHLRLNRLVALKMIRTGTNADIEEQLRFVGEARAAARLQHVNVVQIFEIGEHGGQPYFSLEFVDGGSLDDRIAGKP